MISINDFYHSSLSGLIYIVLHAPTFIFYHSTNFLYIEKQEQADSVVLQISKCYYPLTHFVNTCVCEKKNYMAFSILAQVSVNGLCFWACQRKTYATALLVITD